jgi:hypothetical protein
MAHHWGLDTEDNTSSAVSGHKRW